MKMFRARFNRVEEFEIIKQTEKQVVYLNEYKREQRESKITDWQSWHSSKEEAVNFMVAKKQKEINLLLGRIEYIKIEINKIYNLLHT